MELNNVHNCRSLLFVVMRAAPSGNTRSSPATGAVPPQLAAVLQLPSTPAHVQVLVAAKMDPVPVASPTTVTTARKRNPLIIRVVIMQSPPKPRRFVWPECSHGGRPLSR